MLHGRHQHANEPTSWNAGVHDQLTLGHERDPHTRGSTLREIGGPRPKPNQLVEV